MPKRPAEGADKSYLRFYVIAFELVFVNVGLILGGYYIDKFIGSSPVFILIGTLAAMAVTILILLRSSKS